MATGLVRKRESVNKDLANGDVEVYVTRLNIVAKAKTPPFEINERVNVGEELRLKYRYLDLRRSDMHDAIIMRHRIVKVARDYYDRNGFLEIETPMLIRSTPEGARDYLVPSRVHKGSFYALPQSPQLYKQLLMVAGFDRYMQIARCFRDEDLRADRQPEFTQIDLEMSFADEEDIMSVNEGFVKEAFQKILGVEIKTPFKRLTYKEAMNRYGSDKPDTRFSLELKDISDLVADCEFKAFFFHRQRRRHCARALNAKGAAEILTRKEIDKLTDLAKTYKSKGLAYTRLAGEGSSSYEKFLTKEECESIRERLDAKEGDVILIVADKDIEVACQSLGSLRLNIAKRMSLIPPESYDLLWVTDFPLFERDDEGNIAAKHHPFTSPKFEDFDRLTTDPLSVNAKAYDMVLNGVELGGGSIRITDPETQMAMFKVLGFTSEEAKEKFGFLLEAYQYGAPQHGGMAYGLDRLVMLMLNKDSIRDVIAFPKVQNASELMSMAPSGVDDKSLKELGIKLDI